MDDEDAIQDEDGEGGKPVKQGEDNAKEAEKVMLQNIERFVQRIRMVSQQIIQDQSSKEETKRDRQESMADEEPSMLSKEEETTAKVTSFDPDEDGFEFGIEKASVLHKNINIL